MHVIETYSGSGSALVIPLILSFGTRWGEWRVSYLENLTPWEKNRRLSGSETWSGHFTEERNLLHLPVIKPRNLPHPARSQPLYGLHCPWSRNTWWRVPLMKPLVQHFVLLLGVSFSSQQNWTLAHPPRPGGLVPSRAHECLVWCNRAAGLIHVQTQQSPLRFERWHADAVTVTNTTVPFAPSQLCGHKSRICAAYPFVSGGGRGGVKFKTLWAGCGSKRTTHDVHSAELNLAPFTGWELPHISPSSSSCALEG